MGRKRKYQEGGEGWSWEETRSDYLLLGFSPLDNESSSGILMGLEVGLLNYGAEQCNYALLYLVYYKQV